MSVTGERSGCDKGPFKTAFSVSCKFESPKFDILIVYGGVCDI